MKNAIVIFTGINFSHYMADLAISWAARNGTSLQALFLKAGKEKEEGYIFPSDLDEAQNLTTRKEAEKNDRQLIHDYQKILNDLGKEKKVTMYTRVLTDPTLQDVVSITKEAAIVFINASYDSSDILSPKEFILDDLKQKSNAPVEVVHEP